MSELQAGTEPTNLERRRALHPPLWLAAGGLFVALVLVWWSAGVLKSAQVTATRSQNNAARAHNAAQKLLAIIPPQLPGDAGTKISGLIDRSLKSAGVSDRMLRSQTIRSMGALGQTAAVRQQARIELGGLSLKQAGSILQSLESSELPVWIDSSDLTAASGDQWNLTIELDWLQARVP